MGEEKRFLVKQIDGACNQLCKYACLSNLQFDVPILHPRQSLVVCLSMFCQIVWYD